MLDDQKLNKIKELTKRAVSINLQLLEEEKRFIDALSPYSDTNSLNECSDQLRLLIRKEVLYIQAVQNLLH